MTIALWIIAVCEVIRIAQNTLQLKKMYSSEVEQMQKNAYQEFIKSLNRTEAEFVEELLEEFRREQK